MLKTEQQEYHLLNEIRIVWGYRWQIVGVCLLSGLFSFIYTLPAITPPEYKAVAAFVPPNLDDVKSLNFLKIKFNGFGAADDPDLERIAGVLSSDTAAGYMIKKFQLAQHYAVETISDPAQRARALRDKYNSKIDVKLTRFSTVQVEVYDENPKLAADIANAFIAYADSFVEQVARRKEGIQALEQSIKQMEQTRARVQDTLALYRTKYKLYRLDDLSEVISQQLAAGPFQNPAFHQNYDKIQALEHEQRYLEEHIADMHNELVFRKENLATYPSLINVVGAAIPPGFKARPQRLLILILTVGLTFLVSSLSALFYARFVNKIKA